MKTSLTINELNFLLSDSNILNFNNENNSNNLLSQLNLINSQIEDNNKLLNSQISRTLGMLTCISNINTNLITFCYSNNLSF